MATYNKILNAITKLAEEERALSLFLYGSWARGEEVEGSDFEFGMIFPGKSKASRRELKEKIGIAKVSVYPFSKEEIINYNPDIPFEPNIFLRELTLTAKTLYGDEIIESLKPPKISYLNILNSLYFQKGYNLAAVRVYDDNKVSSYNLWRKAFIFSLRNLALIRNKKFLINNIQILKAGRRLVEEEYLPLFDAVNNPKYFTKDQTFKTIKLINQIIQIITFKPLQLNNLIV